MKTVLVIDDSKFMMDRLVDILVDQGKEVVGKACNGEEGVKLYKELKPDLVFLDINMPVLRGRDALVQIMNFDPDATVVMCSTEGAEDLIRECIEEGAVYYVLKPFVKGRVEEVLKEIGG